MKKIPTLFTRVFENGRIVGIKDEITPGCEDAFKHGVATIKYDGSCCATINGDLYRRFDAKKGRKIPEGAIPCCDPDPVTGHWPHWVVVDPKNPADKWFWDAFCRGKHFFEQNTTYEIVGPHFQGNPYKLKNDMFIEHGCLCVDVDRDFESISNWLNENCHEGLVFWLNGEPVCKIKRTDFGYKWPIK